MTPDVNVLVAASRTDHPHHGVALPWLTAACATAPALGLGLLPTVVASYLRLVTHPKVFAQPTPTADALALIDALLVRPGVCILGVQDEWPRLRALCADKQLRGNALPDAWIAACVLNQKEILVTFDKDFIGLLPAENLQLLQPPTP